MREVGPWLMSAFKLMARLRGLRGSWLDPLRNSDERRLDRALASRFAAHIGELLAGLNDDNRASAVALAALPEKIRGYGHVRQANADTAAVERERLLQSFRHPTTAF